MRGNIRIKERRIHGDSLFEIRDKLGLRATIRIGADGEKEILVRKDVWTSKKVRK